MKDYQYIVDLLPYKDPFLFVDSIDQVDENGITGHYQIKENEFYFQGHFPGNPIVPGVILIEVMAQIGLVCFGIYLLKTSNKLTRDLIPAFSSSRVNFLEIARPGDRLKVQAKKVYYRFNKLRCSVECINLTTGKKICNGEVDGFILKGESIE